MRSGGRKDRSKGATAQEAHPVLAHAASVACVATGAEAGDADPRAAVYRWLEKEEHAVVSIKRESV